MFLLEIAKAFSEAKLKYAVVGGFAVALHGAVRGTVDIDLVLSLKKADFLAAEKMFSNLGLESRLPLKAAQVFDFREEYIRERGLVAWSFFDPIHPQNQLDVILTEDLNELDTEVFSIRGVKVRVVALKDLISMKLRSGRPQDLEDVKALRSIQKK